VSLAKGFSSGQVRPVGGSLSLKPIALLRETVCSLVALLQIDMRLLGVEGGKDRQSGFLFGGSCQEIEEGRGLRI
jgi:hypothetical protein